MENYFLPVKLLKDMAIVNHPPPTVQTIVCWHGTWNLDPTKILNIVGCPSFSLCLHDHTCCEPHYLPIQRKFLPPLPNTSLQNYAGLSIEALLSLLYVVWYGIQCIACTFPWTVSQTALSFISQPSTKLNLKNKNHIELIKPTVCCSGLCCCTTTNLLLLFI